MKIDARFWYDGNFCAAWILCIKNEASWYFENNPCFCITFCCIDIEITAIIGVSENNSVWPRRLFKWSKIIFNNNLVAYTELKSWVFSLSTMVTITYPISDCTFSISNLRYFLMSKLHPQLFVYFCFVQRLDDIHRFCIFPADHFHSTIFHREQ